MTTSRQPAYKAPDGFYQNYTFDQKGQVYADGKALSGVLLDVNSLKDPADSAPVSNDIASLAQRAQQRGQPKVNPFASAGGGISRLSVDAQGNVFAEIGAPTKPAIGSGPQGTKGPGMPLPQQPTQAQQLSQPAPQKVQLSGFQLDPERTSRNGTGDLGNNNAYVRQDRDGLYFVQVNKGDDIVAYAYNKYQGSKLPVASTGPDTDRSARRKGGNAGGGVGPSAPSDVTLLGS